MMERRREESFGSSLMLMYAATGLDWTPKQKPCDVRVHPFLEIFRLGKDERGLVSLMLCLPLLPLLAVYASYRAHPWCRSSRINLGPSRIQGFLPCYHHCPCHCPSSL